MHSGIAQQAEESVIVLWNEYRGKRECVRESEIGQGLGGWHLKGGKLKLDSREP